MKTSVNNKNCIGFTLGVICSITVIFVIVAFSKSIRFLSVISSVYLGSFVGHIFRCMKEKTMIGTTKFTLKDKQLIFGCLILTVFDLIICFWSFNVQKNYDLMNNVKEKNNNTSNDDNNNNQHTHSLFDPIIGSIVGSFLFFLPFMIVFSLSDLNDMIFNNKNAKKDDSLNTKIKTSNVVNNNNNNNNNIEYLNIVEMFSNFWDKNKNSFFSSLFLPFYYLFSLITYLLRVDLCSEKIANNSKPLLFFISILVFGCVFGGIFIRPHLNSVISFSF
jgi:hypothetical protein